MTLGLVVECASPFVSEEAQALRRIGLRVEVASVFRPLPARRWTDAFDGPVDYPPAGRFGWGLRALRDGASGPRGLSRVVRLAATEGAPPRLVALALRLARRARREGWTHVHASFATYPAWTAWAAATLAQLPWSFTAHAYDVQEARPWLGRLVREARFVRAISEEGATRLRRVAGGSGGEVRVGRLGVDTERFRPGEPAAGDVREIVCVAQLGPTKGIPVLLAAAARLCRAGRRFTLRILGDGPLRAELEAQVRSLGVGACVRFEGAADRAAVARALRGAAVFALPCVTRNGGARHDGLPVALLEAMACALPVVTTPVGGIPEVVSTENGVLVPPGDDAALALALAALLGDEALCRRLGATARATILERHEARAAAARLAAWIGESRPPARAGAAKRAEGAHP
jgi:glycosyltransferase involved in cell wall biosynthesis